LTDIKEPEGSVPNDSLHHSSHHRDPPLAVCRDHSASGTAWTDVVCLHVVIGNSSYGLVAASHESHTDSSAIPHWFGNIVIRRTVIVPPRLCLNSRELEIVYRGWT
jgi:hypothetical protein